MAGRWSSLQNGVANLAGIVAPWVTGLIVKFHGSARLAFVLTGVVHWPGHFCGVAGAPGGASGVGCTGAPSPRLFDSKIRDLK